MSRVSTGIGYIPTAAKSLPKRRSSPGARRRANAACTASEHSVRPTTSQMGSFCGARWRMYSGNRSIFTRVEVPSSRILPLFRPGSGRYRGDHVGIDVVREHPIELEMKERPFHRAPRLDIGDHRVHQGLYFTTPFHPAPVMHRLQL